MKQITDLEKIKSITTSLLHLPMKQTQFEFIVDHPIFQSPYWIDKENNMVDMRESEEALNKAYEEYEKRIDRITNPLSCMYICRSAYFLTFLKFTRAYWSADDFAIALSEAWVEEENPNGDINVPVSLSEKWFKKAPKELLMNLDEYETYISLPDSFTVYRGVGRGRNPEGMSWTDNLDSAKWFASRFGDDGYVIRGIVNRSDVLAYFSRRNECEVVIPSDAVKEKSFIYQEELIAV